MEDTWGPSWVWSPSLGYLRGWKATAIQRTIQRTVLFRNFLRHLGTCFLFLCFSICLKEVKHGCDCYYFLVYPAGEPQMVSALHQFVWCPVFWHLGDAHGGFRSLDILKGGCEDEWVGGWPPPPFSSDQGRLGRGSISPPGSSVLLDFSPGRICLMTWGWVLFLF